MLTEADLRPLADLAKQRGCYLLVDETYRDVDAFYERLLEKHGTYVGPGHWFAMPDTHFRLGYGWPTADELTGGLAALSKALRG